MYYTKRIMHKHVFCKKKKYKKLSLASWFSHQIFGQICISFVHSLQSVVSENSNDIFCLYSFCRLWSCVSEYSVWIWWCDTIAIVFVFKFYSMFYFRMNSMELTVRYLVLVGDFNQGRSHSMHFLKICNLMLIVLQIIHHQENLKT